KDDVTANIVQGLLRSEVPAGFLYHHGKLQFVIKLLGQVPRIDHRFAVPDNSVHVLKKDDPRQHRMRKTGLRGLFVMLAEITGGVEELLGNNWRFYPDQISAVKDGLSRRPAWPLRLPAHVVERSARRIQALVATFKKGAHIGGNTRLGNRRECRIILHITQVQ